MPFVPVPDTVELEIRATYLGEHVENTLWFSSGNPIDSAAIDALCEAVRDAWASEIMPLLTDSYTLVEVAGRDMSSETGAIGTSPAAADTVGGNGNAYLPGNVSFVVSFRTGVAGRSFRGRNYIVGLSKSNTTGNQLSSSIISQLLTGYVAVVAAAEALGWNHVVASRFSGVDSEGKPIPRTTGIATTVTSYISVDNNLDSQRRRLAGRGQ